MMVNLCYNKKGVNMKNIYIIIPSEETASDAYRNFKYYYEKISGKLNKLGFKCCSFFEVNDKRFNDEHNLWVISSNGIYRIEYCDALLVFDNDWHKSINARFGILKAIEFQVPVFFNIETMKQYFESKTPLKIYNKEEAANLADYVKSLSEKDKQESQPPLSNFEKIGHEIGELVTEKNKAYGNAFEKSCDILTFLYPEGIPVNKMQDALTVVRIIDKLIRIATDKDAFGEDPFRDIAGYSILAVEKRSRLKQK
jgi:hypothetical protein